MSLLPPHPPLPPLNALRAFEAAARHGSFQRAAEELSVSPGAVAQQIRKLEDWAGVTLFKRHPQGVTATPLARQVLTGLTAGFEHLGNAARTLRQSADVTPVRVAALPAIAQLWIAPRLSDLQSRLPGIEFSVHALDLRPELTHGAFDITLYPQEPSQNIKTLTENALTPLAAPSMAGSLQHPDDLKDAILLHDTTWAGDWAFWMQTQQITGIDPGRGPTYSLYSLAVERCIAGDGVLIGHTALTEHLVQQGQLVAPFPDLAAPSLPICLETPLQNTSSIMVDVAAAIVAVA